MSQVQELKEKANSLRSAQQFSEAIAVYEILWNEYKEECSETDWWSYAVCLQKSGRQADALAIAEVVFPEKPDYNNMRNVYCWATYFTKVKVDRIENEADFLDAARRVVENSRQQDKNYPYLLAVYKVLDFLERKFPSDPEGLVEWTDRLDPAILDDKPQAVKLKDGKEKEFPSDKEKYYAYRSKALLEVGRFDDCVELCDEGLEAIEVFHFDNDNWLRRRKAVCKEKQGDIEGAMVILMNVLRRKDDWSSRLGLARLQYRTGEKRKAMLNCVDGATQHGDFERKGSLYKFMAEMLFNEHRIEDAKKHISYAYVMQKEARMNIDPELLLLAQQFGIDLNTLPEGRRLAGVMRRLWDDIRYEDQIQYTGVIRSVLPNGKAAFVEEAPRKSYFFSRKDFKGKDDEFVAGANVTFYLIDGFDTKKGIATRNAVNVRLVR